MIYTFHTGKCFQMTVPHADLGRSMGGRCKGLQDKHCGKLAGTSSRRRSSRLKAALVEAKAQLSDLLPSLIKSEIKSPEGEPELS